MSNFMVEPLIVSQNKLDLENMSKCRWCFMQKLI